MFGSSMNGSTAMERGGQSVRLSATELRHADRADHARRQGQMIAALAQRLGALARRAVADWKQRQAATRTVHALRGLDARALHDLGVHSSEIGSVAAELAGTASSTRVGATVTRRIR